MSAKVPGLEDDRPGWTDALKTLHQAIRKSPALRKSEAPVSLLEFLAFTLQTTVTALPNADGTGKWVNVGANLVVGAAKLAFTSDPRALMQGVGELAGEAFDKAKRKYYAFYAQQLSFFALRVYQPDPIMLKEVRLPHKYLS